MNYIEKYVLHIGQKKLLKSWKQYNEFNKVIIQKWILYLWILKTAKSDPHRLLLNLTDKISLKRSDMLLCQKVR